LPVRVATYIRDAILSGHLPQGARLREIEFAQKLGISRSPLREAFRILESEGLLEVVPRKGVFVVKTSPEEAHEVYEVRSLIEGYGARLAASRIEEQELKHMRRLLEEMRRISLDNRYWDYQATSLEFHDTFMRASGNHKLLALYSQTRKFLLRIQALAVGEHRVSQESVEEHGSILEALERRDPDAAEAAARRHVGNVLSRTGEHAR
jgi:DNA-binding GntR family transcriptional regulator